MRSWAVLFFCVSGALAQQAIAACNNPSLTSIPPTNVQYFVYPESTPPSFLSIFFLPNFNAVLAGFQNGVFPFGHSVTCPGLPAPNTDWLLGSEANPSNLLVRFNVFIPSSFVGNTFSLTVDNDLVAVWVNGALVPGVAQIRDNCGPVSTPITFSIPLNIGSNLITLAVRDRGVQSFLDVSLQVNLCPDACDVAAAGCRFAFLGHLMGTPVFPLGNTPNGPGFTTQVIARNLSLFITDMNANFKPQFIDPITGVRINVDAFGLTTFQFKPFNQPFPMIGFETFQGNTRSLVDNRCVIINFSNWRTTFQNGNIVNVNLNNPADCTDCCVVFRTGIPA